jgi:hypothetical protein
MDARPDPGERLIGGSACRERYGKLVKEAVIARVEHKKPLPAHFQKRYHPYRMSESKDSLKPASYTGAGAALL